MAVIQVTPELLTGKAGDVRKLKGEQEQVIQKLTTLVNGLSGIWKGEAQDAFVSKYTSMQPTFKNFAEMLEGYAKLMDTAAKELQATDQALKSTMNSFG